MIDPSTNKIIDRIYIGVPLFGIVYNPYNDEMYTTTWTGNSAFAINATSYTVIRNITVGETPVGLAYDSNNHDMYVVNDGDGTVSRIASNNTVVATLGVGPGPKWAVFAPTTGDVYVTNTADSSLTVLP